MKSADGRECSEFLRDKKIVLSGRRTTKVYLKNPRGRIVEKIEVDGCAIENTPACDWLVRLNRKKPCEEIYVELKGSKIERAVEQIKATISKLSVDQLHLPKRCLVVLNRCPITSTDVQIYKAGFMKAYRARFQTVKSGAEVEL